MGRGRNDRCFRHVRAVPGHRGPIGEVPELAPHPRDRGRPPRRAHRHPPPRAHPRRGPAGGSGRLRRARPSRPPGGRAPAPRRGRGGVRSWPSGPRSSTAHQVVLLRWARPVPTPPMTRSATVGGSGGGGPTRLPPLPPVGGRRGRRRDRRRLPDRPLGPGRAGPGRWRGQDDRTGSPWWGRPTPSSSGATAGGAWPPTVPPGRGARSPTSGAVPTGSTRRADQGSCRPIRACSRPPRSEPPVPVR